MSLPQIAMSFRRVHVVMKPVLESPGTRREFSPVPVRGKSEAFARALRVSPTFSGPPPPSSAPRPPSLLAAGPGRSGQSPGTRPAGGARRAGLGAGEGP